MSVHVLACSKDESPRLQERSQPARMPNEPASTPTQESSASDASSAPPDAERIALRLALPQGQTYRVTTVAMVELPMVNEPFGWAREEEFEFEDCEGEAFDRTCTLRHRYTKFEAQPPAGALLEADERKVAPVTSRHRISATGYREGQTQLEGMPTDTDAELADALSSIHRLYCIRFPKEPIGVGAKWNDMCRTFDRGVAVTRHLHWELSALSEDPEDPTTGKRAELRGVGQYVVTGPMGERKGTVEMVLYFFADHGEPHLLRERRSIPVSAERGAYTKETVNIQFAKVDVDPQNLVRTDGRPFPMPDSGAGVLEPTPEPLAPE